MVRMDGEEQLPASQGELLFIVSHEGPISSTELAKTMQLTPGAITQLVESLERAGLVERKPSPADRRVTLINISDAGRERMSILMERKVSIFQEVYKDLSIEEIRIMNGVQKKMIEHLKKLAADSEGKD
jgi:DNA-binding MarR family transcriptional regulator